MKRSFSPSPRSRNRDQVKLVTARMCIFLLCLPWWLYGLHVLILEVNVSFLVLSFQISSPASEKGTAAYLDKLSWGYDHYSTKIPSDSKKAGVKMMLMIKKKKKKSLEEAVLHSQVPSALWTRSFFLSHTCWDLLSQESWVLHSTGFYLWWEINRLQGVEDASASAVCSCELTSWWCCW